MKKNWTIFDKRNIQITNEKDVALILKGRMFANWHGNLLDISHLYLNSEQTNKIILAEVARCKIGFIGKDRLSSRIYTIHGKSVTLMAGGCPAKQGHYLSSIRQKPITIGNANPSGKGMNGRICSILGKSHTLTCNKGEGIKTGIHQIIGDTQDPYVFACQNPDRLRIRQNGQRFNNGNKGYALTTMDRHGILRAGYIRKLHPIECERLQTLGDGYCEGISNTQRYKAIGNSWTVDVIVHLLKCLIHK